MSQRDSLTSVMTGVGLAMDAPDDKLITFGLFVRLRERNVT